MVRIFVAILFITSYGFAVTIPPWSRLASEYCDSPLEIDIVQYSFSGEPTWHQYAGGGGTYEMAADFTIKVVSPTGELDYRSVTGYVFSADDNKSVTYIYHGKIYSRADTSESCLSQTQIPVELILPPSSTLGGLFLSFYSTDSFPTTTAIGGGIDSDGDGFSDVAELATGSDKDDSLSKPIVSPDGKSISGSLATITIDDLNEINPDSFNITTYFDENGNLIAHTTESIKVNLDSDSDGINDQIEVQHNSNPFDSSSLPTDFKNATPGDTFQWSFLSDNTDIRDSKTNKLVGKVVDNGIEKYVELKADDGTIYKVPTSEFNNIPILNYGLGAYEVPYIIADFPDSPDAPESENEAVYKPPLVNLPDISNSSTVINNVTNITNNDSTSSGGTVSVDMSGVENKLDEIKERLKTDNLDSANYDDSALDNTKDTVLGKIKTSFNSNYSRIVSTIPDSLKLNAFVVSRKNIPSFEVLGYQVNLFSNPSIIVFLGWLRSLFTVIIYIFFIKKFWENHRISG